MRKIENCRKPGRGYETWEIESDLPAHDLAYQIAREQRWDAIKIDGVKFDGFIARHHPNEDSPGNAR